VIEPDTKNWTWVLERPCAECGFDAATVQREGIAGLILQNAAQWPAVLARPAVRSRPRPDKWSPLEYACHVRDVHRVMGERLRLMVESDEPTFANWDQDERAVSDDYGAQDPGVVADELLPAAALHAARFDSITEPQWSRGGTRSDGSRFTVFSLGVYGLHDPYHHLWDVTTAP
jgi:hypothetical protein